MSKPYSLDLRERVVDTVEAGASRHEAAERFEVSVSSAIRWVQRRMKFGSVAAKPIGGSISPLETHAAWLLNLIAKRPDLTLDEIAEYNIAKLYDRLERGKIKGDGDNR